MAVPPPPAGARPAADPAKPALREALFARRAAHVAALGAQATAEASRAATLILPHIAPGAVVAVYLAFHDELDPAPLVERLTARGHHLALPALLDDTTMLFRSWSPGEPVERGPFRLRQPLPSAAECAPDIIVTPLVGFDRHGGRIGHGKSHYDRAFVRYAGARRLGLAWDCQEVERLPHDPWDVALHAVATETRFMPMPETKE